MVSHRVESSFCLTGWAYGNDLTHPSHVTLSLWQLLQGDGKSRMAYLGEEVASIHELPRRGILGNPFASSREVMRRSTTTPRVPTYRHTTLPQYVVVLDRH